MNSLWIQRPNDLRTIFDDVLDDKIGQKNMMQSPFAAIHDQFMNDPFFQNVLSVQPKPESDYDCHKPMEKETKVEQDDANHNFQVYSYESVSETRDGHTTRKTQRRYRDNAGRDFVKESKLLNGMELLHEKRMMGEKVLHEARSLVNTTGEEPEATVENFAAFDKEWEKQICGEEKNALADWRKWTIDLLWLRISSATGSERLQQQHKEDTLSFFDKLFFVSVLPCD